MGRREKREEPFYANQWLIGRTESKTGEDDEWHEQKKNKQKRQKRQQQQKKLYVVNTQNGPYIFGGIYLWYSYDRLIVRIGLDWVKPPALAGGLRPRACHPR